MAAPTSEPNWSTVLAALNDVLADQQEMLESLRRANGTMDGIGSLLKSLESTLEDTNARVRSLQDTTGEIKDLLIRALACP